MRVNSLEGLTIKHVPAGVGSYRSHDCVRRVTRQEGPMAPVDAGPSP